jgi:hypothetical protein
MQSTTPPAAEGGNVGEAGSQEACSDAWGVVRFGLSCVSAITSVAGSLTWMAAAVIPGQDRADTTTTSHAISHRPISTPHDTYNTSTAHRAVFPTMASRKDMRRADLSTWTPFPLLFSLARYLWIATICLLHASHLSLDLP